MSDYIAFNQRNLTDRTFESCDIIYSQKSWNLFLGKHCYNINHVADKRLFYLSFVLSLEGKKSINIIMFPVQLKQNKIMAIFFLV